MKTKRLITILLLLSCGRVLVLAQPSPTYPASQSQVNAGIVGAPFYVTPLTLGLFPWVATNLNPAFVTNLVNAASNSVYTSAGTNSQAQVNITSNSLYSALSGGGGGGLTQNQFTSGLAAGTNAISGTTLTASGDIFGAGGGNSLHNTTLTLGGSTIGETAQSASGPTRSWFQLELTPKAAGGPTNSFVLVNAPLWAATFGGDGSSLTNLLNLAKFTAGANITETPSKDAVTGTTNWNIAVSDPASFNQINATTFYATNLLTPTNLLAGPAVDFAKAEWTATINSNLTFSSVANLTADAYNETVIHLIASGADRTIAFPASFHTNLNAILVITNGFESDFLVTLQAGVRTNVAQIVYP